jgi:DNA-binding LacI/PurR family transcriptional regulator
MLLDQRRSVNDILVTVADKCRMEIEDLRGLPQPRLVQRHLHRVAIVPIIGQSNNGANPGMPGRDSTPPDTPLAMDDLASRRFVGAQAVAEAAGVSRSAVSRTFTPGASVSEETRQRVLAAAEALGYHVNHLARGVSRQETGIVCLVVADVDAAQPSRLARAITERLQEAGKVAVLLCVGGPSDDIAATLRRALNYRADATIVMSGTPAQSIVRECLDNGQRLILISRDDRIVGPDNILLDNAGAAHKALSLFLRAGCRRPAVVTTELGTPSLSARADAFIDAARAVGIERRQSGPMRCSASTTRPPSD